jgi:hypothetical protein
MHNFTLPIALSAAALAMPAAAQTYTPERILEGVKLDDLKAIVSSFEDEVISEGMAGETSLAARSADGTVYLLLGTACGNETLGCQGVNMQVRFDTEEIDREKVNRANMAEQALNTWFDADTNTLGFSRYVVLDHGITMGNLRENVVVLLAIAPSAADNFR